MLRGHAAERVVVEIRLALLDGELQQILVQRREKAAARGGLRTEALRPERIEVCVAETPPIHELNRKLERALRVANEVVFVEPQIAVELADCRYRRFADAHGSDFFRFDENDPARLAMRSEERRVGKEGRSRWS